MGVVETWKAVPGWEGSYEVSDRGRVKSLARQIAGPRGPANLVERVLVPTPDDGYLKVKLHREGVGFTRKVHSLVALAFIGPPPEGLEVCHNDGDKANNTPENLRYDTRSANQYDNVRHGINPNARKTHCKTGHQFTAENTYIRSNGNRACRECKSIHDRKRKAARRLSRLAS